MIKKKTITNEGKIKKKPFLYPDLTPVHSFPGKTAERWDKKKKGLEHKVSHNTG